MKSQKKQEFPKVNKKRAKLTPINRAKTKKINNEQDY